MTTKDIAQLISMKPASLDTYCSAGLLTEGTHYFRKGRRRRFSRKAMWAWATATEAQASTANETVIPFANARRRQG